MTHRLFIVDVFAETKYAGNPLAVIADAADLPTERMQAIARETNFSETTFVLHDAPRDGAFDVRIFTPREEIPFAGHPTLGTAWILHHEIRPEPRDSLVLRLGVGPVPVAFERGADGSELLWMRQPAPRFGPVRDAGAVVEVLGLRREDLVAGLPVQQVSTGLPFWIVPLRDLDAVRRCRVDSRACASFIEGQEAKAILVYASQAYDPANQVNARMFAEAYGVPEDPATGSAQGCLAAYLVEHRVLGGAEIDIRAEQGCEIGRPSLLYLRARKSGESFEVRVGGRVIAVARGELL